MSEGSNANSRASRTGTGVLIPYLRGTVLVVVMLLVIAACDFLSSEPEGETDEAVFPVYVDDDGNGVNDYVEASGHTDSFGKARPASAHGPPHGPASAGHAFNDENGDGICDYAQNGSATWHGPGFVDENGDGRCDYWEPGGRGHGSHGGHHGGGHHGGSMGGA